MKLIFNGGYYFGNAGHQEALAPVVQLLESSGFHVELSTDTGEGDTAPSVLLVVTRQPTAKPALLAPRQEARQAGAPPADGAAKATEAALETLNRTKRDP